MICWHGGLTSVHHNEICNITAEWLSKVCYGAANEPPLQHLTRETIILAIANQHWMRYALISMLGDFGGNIRVPFLMSEFFTWMYLVIATQNILSIYQHHEQEKKWQYGDRFQEVEKASFIPIVFATTKGMGKQAIIFYHRLAVGCWLTVLQEQFNVQYYSGLGEMHIVLFYAAISCSVHLWESVHLS